MAARAKMFTIRMSPDETARAERVAKHYGITVAALIRMLIKRDEDQRGTQQFVPMPPLSRGIYERAVAIYLRHVGAGASQPSRIASDWQNGSDTSRPILVLRNVHGELARLRFDSGADKF